MFTTFLPNDHVRDAGQYQCDYCCFNLDLEKGETLPPSCSNCHADSYGVNTFFLVRKRRLL